MPKPKDYTGQVFHRLTAIKYTGKRHQFANSKVRKRIWLFQCECGKQTEKMIEKVVKGWTKSCGCLKTTRSPLQTLQYAIFLDSYSDGDLSETDFFHLSQQNCFYCNKPPSNTRTHRYYKDLTHTYNGLDRLDSSQPHNKNNVVPCCWICNNMKKNYSVQEFYNIISTIYHNRIKNETITHQIHDQYVSQKTSETNGPKAFYSAEEERYSFGMEFFV